MSKPLHPNEFRPPLISLEALTQRANARIETAKAAEELRKAATKKVRDSKTVDARQAAREELQQANAQAMRMEAELEWIPQYLVAHIQRWRCTCSREGHTPLGLFIRYQHSRMTRTTRDAAITKEAGADYNELPKRIKLVEANAIVCSGCMLTRGFEEYL